MNLLDETWNYKCRLDGSFCNNKESWNNDKCRCECEELIKKEKCDRGFIQNFSHCECEYDTSCDGRGYLDY